MTRRSLLSALTLAVLLAATVAPAHARPQDQTRRRVVVMVGLPGAGKTTLANSLSSRIGAPRHTCGDMIRGWVQARGLAKTPENDQKASRYFAARPGLLAKTLATKIARSPAPVHQSSDRGVS